MHPSVRNIAPLMSLLFLSLLPTATSAEPKATSEPLVNQTPPELSLQDEVYSLPIAEAHKLLLESPSDSERYNKLRAMLKDKSAKIERLTVMRTKPGERSITESISKLRFPITYAAKPKDAKADGSKEFVAIEFETANLGDTIELMPQLGANNQDVDIELIPSRTSYLGNHPSGLDGVVQPIIQTQKIQTKIALKIGKPFFLGTLNPPFADGMGSAKEQRVWLEFLTVTFPQE